MRFLADALLDWYAESDALDVRITFWMWQKADTSAVRQQFFKKDKTIVSPPTRISNTTQPIVPQLFPANS